VSGNKPIQWDGQHRAPGLRHNATWPNKIRTDPYCPSVWAVPSNHLPFVIESGKELPAGTGKPVDMRLRDTLDTRSHIKIPSTACQSFTTATVEDELKGFSGS
jgi:hypothetical protein